MTNLAKRCERLKTSPIRDILHVLEQPNMISFAGGLPAQESFPTIAYNDIAQSQLQYGASEGDTALREKIADELRQLGLDISPHQVLILSGSQQGIDLVSKLLIDSGTTVAVESPTYLAALQVFNLFGAHYTPYQPQSIDTLNNHNPTLIYTIPTFQNPTGYCYSRNERQQLAQTSEHLGSVLFEDDPYRDLAYDQCDRTPVCSFMTSGNWIYQSSFSKTMAPGLRLGYLAASKNLFPHLVKLKQAADLHSNRVGQSIALSLLNCASRQSRLQSVITQYKSKRDYFNKELHAHFNDIAQWHMPKGGLFFWLELISQLDTQDLLQKAIKNKIAFMPGEPFFPEPQTRTASKHIRLNFSLADETQTRYGLAALADMIRDGGLGTSK